MVLNEYGFIDDIIKSFQIDDIIYTKYKTKKVVNMSPHIPTDPDNERSAYSILLLHTVWPVLGERYLIDYFETAAKSLKAKIHQLTIPMYLHKMLKDITHSEAIRNNIGHPQSHNDHDTTPDVTEEDNLYAFDTNYESNNAAEINVILDSPFNLNDDEVKQNITQEHYEFYQTYIRIQMKTFLQGNTNSNQIQGDAELQQLTTQGIVTVDNGDAREEILQNRIIAMKSAQREAYNKLVVSLTSNTRNQLRMFLTGEGGTGKSEVNK